MGSRIIQICDICGAEGDGAKSWLWGEITISVRGRRRLRTKEGPGGEIVPVAPIPGSGRFEPPLNLGQVHGSGGNQGAYRTTGDICDGCMARFAVFMDAVREAIADAQPVAVPDE